MAELTLEQHLARHLRFLKASSDAYDQGHEDEAIRIAVTLRVLLHGGGGAPLLQQLDHLNVHLISTAEEMRPNVVVCASTLSDLRSTMTWGPSGGSMTAQNVPAFDSRNIKRPLPWRDWWSQVVSRLSVDLTRGDIVCAAANKEGAHIAPRLPAGYKGLQAGFWTAQIHDSSDAVVASAPVENQHFSDLRQMAHEVLISPDLAGFMP